VRTSCNFNFKIVDCHEQSGRKVFCKNVIILFRLIWKKSRNVTFLLSKASDNALVETNGGCHASLCSVIN
jgi:hypothetical protein